MSEFTGERVIPGEVDADLLNEHLARYAFASRQAFDRRVLDAGCGTGYGAAYLARIAREVTAIDISQDAIDYAGDHYRAANLRFERASCLEIPAANASFDLVVGFEIIEHLEDWRTFLQEVRRVTAPSGHFLVSTPNKLYYAEARAQVGPNPFHAHEFDYAEFRRELETVFPSVQIFLENHASAIVFAPLNTAEAAESRLEENTGNCELAHFFLAVCSASPNVEIPAFVYVPRAANMLREREDHIEKLQTEFAGSVARVHDLQNELAVEQSNARRRIDELEAEVRQEVASATSLAAELEEKVRELGRCVDYLHAAESTVEERTAWAQHVQAEADLLRGHLAMFQASRWVRIGRKLGLGPVLDQTK